MKKQLVALAFLLLQSNFVQAKSWKCTEDTTMRTTRPKCYSLELDWNQSEKTCQFKIYKADFKNGENRCPTENRQLWVKSVKCKKASEYVFPYFRSSTIQEDGEIHSYSLVTIIPEKFVDDEGVELYRPRFSYMEINDYLGDNYDVDMICTQAN